MGWKWLGIGLAGKMSGAPGVGIAYVFFFSFFDACQCLTFIIRSLFFMNSILRRIFENSTYLLFSQPFIKTEKRVTWRSCRSPLN